MREQHQHHIRAWAATEPKGPLVQMNFTLPALKPNEVKVLVSHAGMCYSDIRLIDGDRGSASVMWTSSPLLQPNKAKATHRTGRA